MKKTIRLKLGADWHYFDIYSEQFRPVGNKRNFLPGDILYRDSTFYKVVPRRKLKEISWSHAGKEIYKVIGRTGNRNTRRMSSDKVLFAFRISKEEEVQTCVNPHAFRHVKTRKRPNYTDEDSETENLTQNLSAAEARAKMLLHKIVRSDPRLKFRRSHLTVQSTNGKTYKISLKTGQVFYNSNQPICVVMYGYKTNFPKFDRILGKALTIAYSPERISTL